jgi:hypothetical protein
MNHEGRGRHKEPHQTFDEAGRPDSVTIASCDGNQPGKEIEAMKKSALCFVAGLFLLVAALMGGCEKEGMSVSGVAPGTGILSGEERIVLEGHGFYQGMGIDVYFGGIKSPAVVVEGDNRLVVTTPSRAKAGMVDLRIQTDQGQAVTVRNGFRFVDSQSWDITEGFAGVNK